MALPVRSHKEEDGSRLDPIDERSRLHGQLQSHLDTWKTLPSVPGATLTPFADVEETDHTYLVEIELAGVRREDIRDEVTLPGDLDEAAVSANLAGGVLTVRAPKPESERPRPGS